MKQKEQTQAEMTNCCVVQSDSHLRLV